MPAHPAHPIAVPHNTSGRRKLRCAAFRLNAKINQIRNISINGCPEKPPLLLCQPERVNDTAHTSHTHAGLSTHTSFHTDGAHTHTHARTTSTQRMKLLVVQFSRALAANIRRSIYTQHHPSTTTTAQKMGMCSAAAAHERTCVCVCICHRARREHVAQHDGGDDVKSPGYCIEYKPETG